MHRVESGRLESATLESEISMSIVTEDEHTQARRRSFLQRLTQPSMDQSEREEKRKYCCGIVNVEPVLLLLAVSIGLFLTSQPLFTYWARCIEVAEVKSSDYQNASILCAAIAATNNTELQDLVERDISSTKVFLQIAGSAPTVLVAPLVGTWSDKNGRKKPLIFAMSGFVLYSICYFFATLTYKTVNIYTWFFLSEIAMGLTGGAATMFATILAIVTDDCRHKLKPGSSSVPVRIGVASAIQSIGILLGTMAVSHLSVPAIKSIIGHEQSYMKAAFIQCVFVTSAFIYAICFVRETHHPKKLELVGQHDIHAASETETRNALCVGPLKKHVYSLIEVIVQRRTGWTRLCLNMAIFFVFIEFLANDSSLLFLLVKRQPFAWTDSMFSIYGVAKGVAMSLGMVLGPLAFGKVKLLGKDSILVMIGTSAAAFSFFLIAFSTTTYQIFMSAGISLFAGCIAPGYRTFLPRMVPKEQTARLLTVVSIVMAFCPILSALIFNSIFNLTMDWWAGFTFFVGGIFQLITVFGQVLIHWLMYPQWKEEKTLKELRKIQGVDSASDSGESRDSEGVYHDRSVSNTTAAGSDFEEDEQRTDDRAPLIT